MREDAAGAGKSPGVVVIICLDTWEFMPHTRSAATGCFCPHVATRLRSGIPSSPILVRTVYDGSRTVVPGTANDKNRFPSGRIAICAVRLQIFFGCTTAGAVPHQIEPERHGIPAKPACKGSLDVLAGGTFNCQGRTTITSGLRGYYLRQSALDDLRQAFPRMLRRGGTPAENHP